MLTFSQVPKCNAVLYKEFQVSPKQLLYHYCTGRAVRTYGLCLKTTVAALAPHCTQYCFSKAGVFLSSRFQSWTWFRHCWLEHSSVLYTQAPNSLSGQNFHFKNACIFFTKNYWDKLSHPYVT